MLLASPGGIYGTLGICLAQLILVAVIGLVSYIWKHAKKSGNNQGAYAKKRDTHRDNISNANSVASWNVSQIDQAQLRENGFIGNDSNKTQPRLGDANTTAIERADGPSLGNFVHPFLALMFVSIFVCVVWFLCSDPSPEKGDSEKCSFPVRLHSLAPSSGARNISADKTDYGCTSKELIELANHRFVGETERKLILTATEGRIARWDVETPFREVMGMRLGEAIKIAFGMFDIKKNEWIEFSVVADDKWEIFRRKNFSPLKCYCFVCKNSMEFPFKNFEFLTTEGNKLIDGQVYQVRSFSPPLTLDKAVYFRDKLLERFNVMPDCILRRNESTGEYVATSKTDGNCRILMGVAAVGESNKYRLYVMGIDEHLAENASDEREISSTNIKGAFGVMFGQKREDVVFEQNVTKSGFYFMPDKPVERFDEYFAEVSPLSHRVVRLVAAMRSPMGNRNEALRIVTMLRMKYKKKGLCVPAVGNDDNNEAFFEEEKNNWIASYMQKSGNVIEISVSYSQETGVEICFLDTEMVFESIKEDAYRDELSMTQELDAF